MNTEEPPEPALCKLAPSTILLKAVVFSTSPLRFNGRSNIERSRC